MSKPIEISKIKIIQDERPNRRAYIERGCPVAQTLKGCVEFIHKWEISEE